MTKFDEMVADGRMPKPKRIDGRKVWDRIKLDEAFAALDDEAGAQERMGHVVMKVRLRDKSGIRLFRYLVEDVDRHGNVRIYLRKRGQPKIRLRELPGTEAFDAEYRGAFRGEVKRAPADRHTPAMLGTMRWLCEQYFASAKFRSLAESTRKVQRGILEEICQRAGDFRYAMMQTPHVAKLRDEKAAFPHAANNRVKALRQLFAWANSPEYGYAKKNPARDVRNLRGTNPDGIRAWTEADAVRYEARHLIGTKAPAGL